MKLKDVSFFHNVLKMLIILLIAFILITLILVAISTSRSSSESRGIDDPEIGFCGKVNSSDARVFGPMVWSSLHTMASNYPESPLDVTKEACGKLITSLTYMLPCSKCGRHFQEFLDLNERNNGVTGSMCMGVGDESVCMNLSTICESRDNLINFFTRAHNNVSASIDPNTELYTVSKSEEEWGDKDICVNHGKWGGRPLDRYIEVNDEEDSEFDT